MLKLVGEHSLHAEKLGFLKHTTGVFPGEDLACSRSANLTLRNNLFSHQGTISTHLKLIQSPSDNSVRCWLSFLVSFMLSSDPRHIGVTTKLLRVGAPSNPLHWAGGGVSCLKTISVPRPLLSPAADVTHCMSTATMDSLDGLQHPMAAQFPQIQLAL